MEYSLLFQILWKVFIVNSFLCTQDQSYKDGEPIPDDDGDGGGGGGGGDGGANALGIGSMIGIPFILVLNVLKNV